MPVIVTFLGMMMWFHNLHVSQQDTALKARRYVLTEASHACPGTANASSADSSVRESLGSGDGSKALDSGGGPLQAALSLFFTPVTREESTEVRGSLYTKAWAHEVHHRSRMMCNEPRYPDGLRGLLPFAKGVAAGLLNF